MYVVRSGLTVSDTYKFKNHSRERLIDKTKAIVTFRCNECNTRYIAYEEHNECDKISEHKYYSKCPWCGNPCVSEDDTATEKQELKYRRITNGYDYKLITRSEPDYSEYSVNQGGDWW